MRIIIGTFCRDSFHSPRVLLLAEERKKERKERRKEEGGERERKLNYPQSTVERRYRGIIDCSRIREASYNNSLEAITRHKSTAIPMKLI